MVQPGAGSWQHRTCQIQFAASCCPPLLSAAQLLLLLLGASEGQDVGGPLGRQVLVGGPQVGQQELRRQGVGRVGWGLSQAAAPRGLAGGPASTVGKAENGWQMEEQKKKSGVCVLGCVDVTGQNGKVMPQGSRGTPSHRHTHPAPQPATTGPAPAPPPSCAGMARWACCSASTPAAPGSCPPCGCCRWSSRPPGSPMCCARPWTAAAAQGPACACSVSRGRGTRRHSRP